MNRGAATPAARDGTVARTARNAGWIAAFFLGVATVAGFAPVGAWPLPVLTIAALIVLWHAAPTPARAARTGFAFGLGFFVTGVSWIYVSLHDFGAMPAPIAAACTLGFCAYLALYPAAAGYLASAMRFTPAANCLLFIPATWTMLEWVRGWMFTGFPWLALGYAQVPAGPLAGYSAVTGIFGVSFLSVASAGGLALCWLWWRTRASPEVSRAAAGSCIGAVLAAWCAGWGLAQVQWTVPVGAPVTVSLVQGNIAQDMKWREDRLRSTLELYRSAVLKADGRLIILPETALPLFWRDVPPEYIAELAGHAGARRGNLLIGVPERPGRGEYYNSVVSIGADPAQAYRKSHLVPFGEFIPLRPVLAGIVNILAIPLQDFSRGAQDQQPLAVSGQRVAVNICYEDVFGEEIIRQLPQATLLVNVSNVAWFGRSIAPQQHLQISQARALETGRYMLRATNTGMTAIVNPRGAIERVAPAFTATTLTHAVQGYAGATPYVRWSNLPVLVLCGALVAVGALGAARRARRRT